MGKDKNTDALKEAEKAYALAQTAIETAAERLENVRVEQEQHRPIKRVRLTRAENGGWIVEDATDMQMHMDSGNPIGACGDKSDLLAFLMKRLK